MGSDRSPLHQPQGGLGLRMVKTLEEQALDACATVTGYALPFQESVIRSLELKGLVSVLSRDPIEGGLYYESKLKPGERAHIDACAADCSDALQFAHNSWLYRGRTWTPAMTAYRAELSAKRRDDQAGIDYDAAFPRGNSGLLGRKTR